MNDEDVKLLPCPFCGGRAELRFDGDDAWTPECQGEEHEHRYIDFPWYYEKADAAEAWNHRAPSDEVTNLRAEIERLTPKPMTLQEACGVLNKHMHRESNTWETLVFPVPGGTITRMFNGHRYLDHNEAVYIAQGLLRDGDPMDVAGTLAKEGR